MLGRRLARMPTIRTSRVNASVRVSSVLDVNPDDATFTILFNLNLKWNDPHLKFFYLKEKNEQNHITDNLSKTIWIPSMKFMLGISICNELYDIYILVRVYVRAMAA